MASRKADLTSLGVAPEESLKGSDKLADDSSNLN